MESNWLLPAFCILAIALAIFAWRKGWGRRPHAPRPFQDDGKFERRRALRQASNPIAVLIQELDEEHPKNYEGWIVNLSADGLAVLLDEPLELLHLVSLHVVSAPKDKGRVDAKVCYSKRVEGGWQTGVEFIRTPLPEALKYFGP